MKTSFYCSRCGHIGDHVDGICPNPNCGTDNSHLIKMNAWYQKVNVVLDSLRKLIDEVTDVK